MTPTCWLGSKENPMVEITATRKAKHIEVRFKIQASSSSLYLSTIYYKLLRSDIVIRGRHLAGGMFKTKKIGGILERYLSRAYTNQKPEVEFTIRIPIGSRYYIHSLEISNPSEGLEEKKISVK